MKKLLPMLALIGALANYVHAQSGLTYHSTFSFPSNAVSSDPVVLTVLDGSDNLISAGTFGGTVDFDPGAGVVNVAAPSTWSSYLQKLDQTGNLLWVKSWGATGTCQPSGVVTLANGDILVAGYFNGTVDCDPGPGVVSFTSPGMNNPYLCKYDAAGNFLWAKHLASTGNAFRSKVYYDATTSKIFWFGHFAGGTMDIDPGAGVITLTSAGGNDGFCVELAANGNYSQHFQIGSTGSELIYDVKTDMSGNIILIGTFAGTVDFDPTVVVNSQTAVGQTDGFLAKYTSIGALLFVRQFAGAGFETCSKLKLLPSGEMYVAGTLDGGTIDLDPGAGIVSFNNNNVPTIFIVQLDNLGNYTNSATFIGGQIGIVDFVIRNTGDLIISGYYLNTADFDPGVGTQLHSTVNSVTFDEYLLQLTPTLNYIDVQIGQSVSNNIQYFGPKSLFCQGPTVIRTGSFSGTRDVNILSGVNNFTALSTADYYINKMTFCTTPTFGTITTSACGQYVAPSGATFTTTGTYIDTILGSSGCDSIITINLSIITPLVPTITAVGDDSVCLGDNPIFTAAVTNGGTTPTYAWYKNGVFQSNNSSYQAFGTNNNDEIYVTLVSSESCVTSSTAVSDTVTMVVGVANASASINITASPGNSACSADTVTFTGGYFNGGNYPNFNWKRNNIPLSMNSATIQLTGLSSGDQLKCILTSSDGCLVNAIDTSNTITMTINASATPNITIVGPNAICLGDTGVYTATFSGGGSNPIINWFINSSMTPVASGTTYSTSTFISGDTLRCVLINNDICAIPNFDISNSIIISVGNSITPTIVVSSVNLTACQGDPINFTSAVTSEGSNPMYQWYVNAGAIPGATNAQFISSTLSNNDAIHCVLTSSLSCAIPTMANSNTINITIIPRAQFTNFATICNGSSYSIASSTYTSSGTYSDTLVSAVGCDSVVTTLLTVLAPVNTNVTQTGATLTATGPGTYQWINCVNNQPIIGDTAQSYMPPTNGNYAVIVTYNNCSDTSFCYNVLSVGETNSINLDAVTVYPNPTQDGSIHMNFNSLVAEGEVVVINAMGQEVSITKFENSTGVDLTLSGESGLYFLQLRTSNQTTTQRIIKN